MISIDSIVEELLDSGREAGLRLISQTEKKKNSGSNSIKLFQTEVPNLVLIVTQCSDYSESLGLLTSNFPDNLKTIVVASNSDIPNAIWLLRKFRLEWALVRDGLLLGEQKLSELESTVKSALHHFESTFGTEIDLKGGWKTLKLIDQEIDNWLHPPEMNSGNPLEDVSHISDLFFSFLVLIIGEVLKRDTLLPIRWMSVNNVNEDLQLKNMSHPPVLGSFRVSWNIHDVIYDRVTLGSTYSIVTKLTQDLTTIENQIGKDALMTGANEFPDVSSLRVPAPRIDKHGEAAWRRSFEQALSCLYRSTSANFPSRPIDLDAKDVATWESDLPQLLSLARRFCAIKQEGVRSKDPTNTMGLFYSVAQKWESKNRIPGIMRPDAFLTDDGLKICELNVGSSIGGPFMISILNHWAASTVPPSEGYFIEPRTSYIAFFSELQKFCNVNDRITMGMLIFEDLSINDLVAASELKNWVESLSAYNVRPVVPRDLRRIGDKLADYHGSFDLLFQYPSLLISNERAKALLEIMLTASETQTIMVSDPADINIEDKTMLAALWQAYVNDDSYLSGNERDLISRYIPETHIFEESLILKAKSCRNQWVLKRANSHAGKHVFAGSDQDKNSWHDLLTFALRDEHPWVLQEHLRVTPKSFLFPGSHTNVVEQRERLFTLSPIVLGSTLGGLHIHVGGEARHPLVHYSKEKDLGLCAARVVERN